MTRPSTHYAVLGMLSIAPMSGYEMRRRMAGSIAHFWSESFGQLYPSLKALTAERLVTARETPSARGGAKRVHQITPAGRRALRDWLATPPHPQPVRNELLLKLFFAKDADRRTVRTQLARVRTRLQAELAAYDAASGTIDADASSADEARYWRATVRYGILRTKAALEWVTETEATFTERPSAPSTARTARRSTR